MYTCCPVHSFDIDYPEAKRIQESLRRHVDITAQEIGGNSDLVGGADAAFITLAPKQLRILHERNLVKVPRKYRELSPRDDCGTMALASVVVYSISKRRVVEEAYAAAPAYFPYIPGYLSFREGPAVLAALSELTTLPGVMIYDGCGIAHPRGLGLASHMALMTGIPSVGCAKSRLCGRCEEPGNDRGSWTKLVLAGDVVGSCLRTRAGVKPVYVSPGSGFSVDGARELVYSLALRYRLPEPTRFAHHLVTARKKTIREHIEG